MNPRSSAKTGPKIETVRLVWLAIFISVFSFLYYQRHGDVLLYGDSVAHINIARRVFDSKTPGLLQLGTVWLPLPHLLIIPFVVSQKMWQSGTGGSLPSMAAFVLGVLGIFRLVRSTFGKEQGSAGRMGAWISAILYAANPNLIYMQSTAMGESMYLAFFIWSLVFFAEFAQGSGKALTKCSYCVAGACLTRYDGWFLAAVLIAITLATKLFSLQEQSRQQSQSQRRKHSASPDEIGALSIARFILIASAAPILWLGYNAAVYRNPLEFANGPYSPHAIEQKTHTVNPAKGSILSAGSYFLKAAELNVANSSWEGRTWLGLALLGAIATWFRHNRILLLLAVPVVFYALSVAYGSVPIFVPTWWPFSNYNVRYGLQLLPAFVVFAPLGISFLVESASRIRVVEPFPNPWGQSVTILLILLLAVSSYAAIWRDEPICYREADLNMRGLIALDTRIGEWIKSLPPTTTFLVFLGQHSGVFERAGIPLARTINEGNHRVWKQPTDPDGLWERALADPAKYADFAIAFEGDPVWTSARDHHLKALVEIHSSGQSPALIFETRTDSSPNSSPSIK
jgi:hypothetical protein